MLKQHRLKAFFVLAFLLSWYPWFLALLQHKQSGPNPLGPLVAAIVITALIEGRKVRKLCLLAWFDGVWEFDGTQQYS